MLAKLIIIVLFLFCSFVSTSSFANLKEIAKQSSLQLDVPETSTVRDIIAILKKEIPNITPYFESLMIAVNMTYVENTYKLNNNDEIALIPPASGG